MKVIKSLRALGKIAIKNSVVTIGVFDGVHAGHRKIVTELVRRAKATRSKSVIMTFDPHPLRVLKGKAYVPSITSLEHRIRLLGALGADYTVILKFTKKFSNLTPYDFTTKILVKKLGAKEIFAGENFYFGRAASSGVKTLERLAGRFSFKVRIIPPVMVKGHVISSSFIRHLIMAGDLDRASKFLARPVSILGTVMRGDRRGRILGFPTANINPHHEAIPPSGVYAVKVVCRKKVLNGVLNIGRRPTFYKGDESAEPSIEVHIFDFNKNIYGEDLEIIFIKRIRPEKRFADREGLAEQIRRDAAKAKKALQV